MDRDPRQIERSPDDEPGDGREDDLGSLIASLPPAPGIRHIDENEGEDEDIGDLDVAIAEGRAFPHDVVAAWLKTWGRPDKKPFKEWLADQDG